MPSFILHSKYVNCDYMYELLVYPQNSFYHMHNDVTEAFLWFHPLNLATSLAEEFFVHDFFHRLFWCLTKY